MAKVMAQEAGESGGSGGSTWMSQVISWAPRKLQQLKSFVGEVKSELKKVTWPSKKEVYATTVVVIVTTLFFGFYLWLLDLGFSWIYTNTIDRL